MEETAGQGSSFAPAGFEPGPQLNNFTKQPKTQKEKTTKMPRRQIDPVTRIVHDYASLSTAERSLVSAAIRGYEIGSGNTGSVARRAPVTPRTTKGAAAVVPSNSGSSSGQ